MGRYGQGRFYVGAGGHVPPDSPVALQILEEEAS